MSIIIETERLRLESIQSLSDELLENLYLLNSDEAVREHFPDGVQTKEQTKSRAQELIDAYINHGTPILIIYDKDSNQFLGRCGFCPFEDKVEVGYLLVRNHWGRGLATEALAALLKWAGDNLKKEIIGFAPTNHVASQRVMEKCGMSFFKEDVAHGVSCKFFKRG